MSKSDAGIVEEEIGLGMPAHQTGAELPGPRREAHRRDPARVGTDREDREPRLGEIDTGLADPRVVGEKELMETDGRFGRPLDMSRSIVPGRFARTRLRQ